MSKISKSDLFQLIKTLTKSEKRSFKLYASRSGNREGMKIVKLFDALERMNSYDEDLLLKNAPEISKSQLSNLKAHLNRQILASLRVTHVHQNGDMQVRELLDHARILYNKGLYLQGLKVLEKAKVMAKDASRNYLVLEVLEFEKVIEAQFVTNSIEDRAETLTSEINKTLESVNRSNDYSNLALKLYGLYIKIGHVKNELEFLEVRKYFKENSPNEEPSKKSFSEQLYYHIAHAWFYYIVQDFVRYYRHSKLWVDLFEKFPAMKQKERTWYLKAQHNLLSALFIVGRYQQLQSSLSMLEDFVGTDSSDFDENTRLLGFIYLNTARINKFIMEGDFDGGLVHVEEIELGLDKFGQKVDQHRFILFYYKIGCLHFGAGNYDQALAYLNKVTSFKDVRLREDIHCFARVLKMIISYELGEMDLLQYQVKSVYHFLGRMDDLGEVQQEIFNFVKRSGLTYPQDIQKEFLRLLKIFEPLMNKPFERRPFLYLDIISWLKSKIRNCTVQEVIKERFENTLDSKKQKYFRAS